MAPNSLSPASVDILYHSAYSPHHMTIPTLEWFPTSISGTLGSFSNWSAGVRDAEDMILDLLNKLKVFVPDTTTFDMATIYTMATPTSARIPRNSKAISVVGTGAATLPTAAWSTTFNGVTIGFGKFKLVLLDAVQPSTWLAPVLPGDFDANVIALQVEFVAASNGWSGRDDNQPGDFSKITYDVNDKLQKAYFGN